MVLILANGALFYGIFAVSAFLLSKLFPVQKDHTFLIFDWKLSDVNNFINLNSFQNKAIFVLPSFVLCIIVLCLLAFSTLTLLLFILAFQPVLRDYFKGKSKEDQDKVDLFYVIIFSALSACILSTR